MAAASAVLLLISAIYKVFNSLRNSVLPWSMVGRNGVASPGQQQSGGGPREEAEVLWGSEETSTTIIHTHWTAVLFAVLCPFVHLELMSCSGNQEVFSRGSFRKVWGCTYHLRTPKYHQGKPASWPAKTSHLERRWRDLLNVFGKWDTKRCFRLMQRSRGGGGTSKSHWLHPSCGLHLTSKRCWSTLAEQHPSEMDQMLTTAGFVLYRGYEQNSWICINTALITTSRGEDSISILSTRQTPTC